MYYIKLLLSTSATQIFDLELFIWLPWAHVARLISCPCLCFPVETSSQKVTRHFGQNIPKLFLSLERWPWWLVTLVEAILQMFMAWTGVVRGTILCSFMTCQEGQGSHLRFRLTKSDDFIPTISIWVSDFDHVVRWSQEPRWISPDNDNVLLQGTMAERDVLVSRAGTRWGTRWLLNIGLYGVTNFDFAIVSIFE